MTLFLIIELMSLTNELNQLSRLTRSYYWLLGSSDSSTALSGGKAVHEEAGTESENALGTATV